MRVIAGEAKGTRLAPVPAGTRPVSDRARESLFSSLGPSVEGARVLDPKGYAFTDNNIAEALALREMLEERRQRGEATGGPAAMTPKDRSRFLARLDETVNAVRRGK